jgi:hypothetical protein
MTIRTCIVLTAVAALLGVAAPAQANNTQLLAVVIKWSAVLEQDGGALGTAVDKGPGPADAAALKMKRDSIAAAQELGAVKPNSAVGNQIRDGFVRALHAYQQSGQELHLAVQSARKNDVKGMNAHVSKAVKLAQTGSNLLTQVTKLLPKLRP